MVSVDVKPKSCCWVLWDGLCWCEAECRARMSATPPKELVLGSAYSSTCMGTCTSIQKSAGLEKLQYTFVLSPPPPSLFVEITVKRCNRINQVIRSWLPHSRDSTLVTYLLRLLAYEPLFFSSYIHNSVPIKNDLRWGLAYIYTCSRWRVYIYLDSVHIWW